MSQSHKQLPPPTPVVIGSPASSQHDLMSNDDNNSSGDNDINNKDDEENAVPEALQQVALPATPKGLIAAAAAGNEAECRRLIEMAGVDVKVKVKGCSAMMAAAEKGHLKVMQYLETRGADIKDKNSCGNSPFFMSIKSGCVDVVAYVLSKGVKIESKWDSLTPIMAASASGSVAVFEFLLSKGASLKDRDRSGRSPFYFASKNGHIQIMRLLLAAEEADVNNISIYGYSSLMVASSKGHVDAVDLLLTNGANVNDKTTYGYTSLMIASDMGHVKVVDLLLNNGSNVNDTSESGNNSLMIASNKGRAKVVDLLLSYGTSVNKASKLGFTSSMAASENDCDKSVDLLLTNGGNISDKNYLGESSLMMASKSGGYKVCRLLLSEEVNINDRNISGNSALLLASSRGRTKVVKLLISKGANILDTNNCGETSLMLAAKCSRGLDTVELLLSEGASIHDRDHEGKNVILHTCFEYSISESFCLNMVQSLLSYGADMPVRKINGLTVQSFFDRYLPPAFQFVLNKWPLSMAILVLRELGLYHHLDCSSIIDLSQYLGSFEKDYNETQHTYVAL